MILRPPITTLTDTLFPYTTLFRSQDRLGLFKYLDNGGDARIYGVETSLAVRPAHFVTLRSAITWNKATLQNFYDPQNGRPPVEPGDPLPGAPKWTISNTISGHWSIAGIDPVVTLVHRYESESSDRKSTRLNSSH